MHLNVVLLLQLYLRCLPLLELVSKQHRLLAGHAHQREGQTLQLENMTAWKANRVDSDNGGCMACGGAAVAGDRTNSGPGEGLKKVCVIGVPWEMVVLRAVCLLSYIIIIYIYIYLLTRVEISGVSA